MFSRQISNQQILFRMSSLIEQYTRHYRHHEPSDALIAWPPFLPSVELAHIAAVIVTEMIWLLNERFIAVADHRHGTECQ